MKDLSCTTSLRNAYCFMNMEYGISQFIVRISDVNCSTSVGMYRPLFVGRLTDRPSRDHTRLWPLSASLIRALRSGDGCGRPMNVTSLPFRAGFYTGNCGTKTTRMKCDQIKATAHHLLGEWTKALV